jgi:hypothetical protein
MHAYLALALVLILALPCPASAQGAPTPPTGPPSGELVPAWVFYWLLGLSSAVGTALITTIGVLWTRSTTDRDAAVKAATDAGTTAAKAASDAGLVAVKAATENMNADLAELRRQATDWRTAFEASEKGRREDAERFRLEEREQLKVSITTFSEVAEALRDNTREIRALISGPGHDS